MPVSSHTTQPLLSPIWRITKAVLAWPLRVVTARRILGQVSNMSDRELRDIGLTRHDVWDATALPLATDPGRLFQARVHERLQARFDNWTVHASGPQAGSRPKRTAKPELVTQGSGRAAEVNRSRFKAATVVPVLFRR